MTQNYVAHYECFITDPTEGDRYLAGHPKAGGEPCFVKASALKALEYCDDPTAKGKLCGCQKATLVHCCEWSKARGFSLEKEGVHCPPSEL